MFSIIAALTHFCVTNGDFALSEVPYWLFAVKASDNNQVDKLYYIWTVDEEIKGNTIFAVKWTTWVVIKDLEVIITKANIPLL